MWHRWKEECGKKLKRRRCEKTEIDGEDWLSVDLHNVGTS
jgi:hypothetical protein